MTEALVDPVVFNPYDYDFHDDPYPIYARLRDESRSTTIRRSDSGRCRVTPTCCVPSGTAPGCRVPTGSPSTLPRTGRTRTW